jgi:hypothetical protein
MIDTAPVRVIPSPGSRVTWLHQPRGGYGYVIPVPATVKRLTARRVLIAADLASGGTKDVWVTPAAIAAAGEG